MYVRLIEATTIFIFYQFRWQCPATGHFTLRIWFKSGKFDERVFLKFKFHSSGPAMANIKSMLKMSFPNTPTVDIFEYQILFSIARSTVLWLFLELHVPHSTYIILHNKIVRIFHRLYVYSIYAYWEWNQANVQQIEFSVVSSAGAVPRAACSGKLITNSQFHMQWKEVCTVHRSEKKCTHTQSHTDIFKHK